jgi:hypothetical protein
MAEKGERFGIPREIWPGAVDPRTGWRFRPPGTGRVYLECRWEGGSDG